ncbi:unnamed protein product [Didymodactylos carnosus]|uniref:Uncharacterized protein n=1 Tax=Didymodactylos carnosus TaxID=1234261 RepID=A0A816A5B1_9BILA|nr:unnamed protein product [Didymodactylos carnosus]CAF4462480.1 unnamed protein product [Didymodactylos carnosus]
MPVEKSLHLIKDKGFWEEGIYSECLAHPFHYNGYIWCSYQRDWLTNSNEGKNKEKLRLDPEFGKILHPMTTKLTNEGLLRRLREVAQNANESLNGIVCSRTLLAESFEETDININSLLLSNLLPNDEKRILRAKRLISQCDTILKEKSKKRLQAIQSMADKAEYGSVEY